MLSVIQLVNHAVLSRLQYSQLQTNKLKQPWLH